MSGRKVGERSTKLLGFIVPHYFYIYNISSHDFGAIQTPRAEIYIFTTGTLYKISSRALLPPSLRTGIFTVECACPEPFRIRQRHQGPNRLSESFQNPQIDVVGCNARIGAQWVSRG